MTTTWPTHMSVEQLAWADEYIEVSAQTFPFGVGDILRDVWRDVRPQPTCDCPLTPYHRWNCALTPLWAQTIRELDMNPWTVMGHA